MAGDVVTSNVLISGSKRHAVHLTSVSDSTGEAAVIKVDKSALVGTLGAEPADLALEKVDWSIQGFSSVLLAWEHTANDTMIVLAAGDGHMDFTPYGCLIDPASDGGTGDVVLTSAGAAGDSYDITLSFKLRN